LVHPRGLRFLAPLVACLTVCTPQQIRYEPVALAAPVADPIEAVVYLIGDAGEVNEARDAVLTHLRQDIESVSRLLASPPITVAFLGDNVYDQGLPTDPTEEDTEKLAGQVRALGTDPNVRGVFLPGNHDWANGASVLEGQAAIARQRDWVERVAPGRDIRFLPGDGCPGPATLDVGASVHLVLIDTEWLLRSPEQHCGSADDFYARLSADLRMNRERPVVLLSHHPLVSGGPHGGNVALLERGPFVYYLARKAGAAIQDLSSRRYATMVRRLRAAIAASGVRPLAQAAGHDHTLQVIGMAESDAPAFQLVSGAAAKSERSRRVDGGRFATDGFGYMRLDFTPEDVALTVFARDLGGGEVRAVFACLLSVNGNFGACPEAGLASAAR